MAEDLYRRVTHTREAAMGDNHPNVLRSRHGLARALKFQGKYDEAECLYRCTIDGLERVLGIDHSDTLNVLANFERTLEPQGRIEEAGDIYQRIRKAQRITGKTDDHPELLHQPWKTDTAAPARFASSAIHETQQQTNKRSRNTPQRTSKRLRRMQDQTSKKS